MKQTQNYYLRTLFFSSHNTNYWPMLLKKSIYIYLSNKICYNVIN